MRMRFLPLVLLFLLVLLSPAHAITGVLALQPDQVYPLESSLQKAGSPVTLDDDTFYVCQNRSDRILYFADEASAPTSRSQEAVTIQPHTQFTFKTVSGTRNDIWIRGGQDPAYVVVLERAQ